MCVYVYREFREEGILVQKHVLSILEAVLQMLKYVFPSSPFCGFGVCVWSISLSNLSGCVAVCPCSHGGFCTDTVVFMCVCVCCVLSVCVRAVAGCLLGTPPRWAPQSSPPQQWHTYSA